MVKILSCKICNSSFEVNKLTSQKYCSKECSIKGRNLSMNKSYKQNSYKWDERKFVVDNRKEFLELLGNECYFCKSTNVELHHKKYSSLKNLRNWKLVEYSKYLLPLCRKCHRKLHKEINSVKQKINTRSDYFANCIAIKNLEEQ